MDDNVVELRSTPDYLVCECGEAWFRAIVSFGPPDDSGYRKVNAYMVLSHDPVDVPVRCLSCGKPAEPWT